MYIRSYIVLRTGTLRAGRFCWKTQSLIRRDEKLGANAHLLQRFLPSIENIEKAVSFQLSGQNCPFLKELKISAILLKYPIFRVFFSSFHGQKKCKNRASGHCTIRTKKLNKVKLRKRSIKKVHVSYTWYKSLIYYYCQPLQDNVHLKGSPLKNDIFW